MCGEAYAVSSVQSLFMGGVLGGCLAFGPLADAVGRRKAALLSAAILTVGSILLPVANGFPTIAALRFLLGLGNAGLSKYKIGWRKRYKTSKYQFSLPHNISFRSILSPS